MTLQIAEFSARPETVRTTQAETGIIGARGTDSQTSDGACKNFAIADNTKLKAAYQTLPPAKPCVAETVVVFESSYEKCPLPTAVEKSYVIAPASDDIGHERGPIATSPSIFAFIVHTP
jgi:hypothetical protein